MQPTAYNIHFGESGALKRTVAMDGQNTFCPTDIIECIDIAENERIRTQGRPVSENLCVK